MSRRCQICERVIYGRRDRLTCGDRCRERKWRMKSKATDEIHENVIRLPNSPALAPENAVARQLRDGGPRRSVPEVAQIGKVQAREILWSPQPSWCEYCLYHSAKKQHRSRPVFNENPWAVDRHDRCPRCGGRRGPWESGPVYDWVNIPRTGSPRRGIVKPGPIMAELGKRLLDPEIRDLAGDLLARHAAGERWHVRKELRKLLGAVQAKTQNVNVTALSEATGIPKRTLYDMTRKGRAELAQKSQYHGGTTMDVTEAPTLARTVNVDHEKRIRELERQVGIPQGGDPAAEQAVEQLIEDSLAASTDETDDA